MEAIEEYVSKYRKERNISIYDAISDMHDAGFSIVQSIMVVARAFELDPPEAKSIVTTHPKWTEFARRASEYQDNLADVFREDQG